MLITGASGYIAHNIIRALQNVPCEIRGVTGSDPGTISLPRNSSAAIQLIKADISKEKTWSDNIENIDVVFHLAAQTSVYEARNNPQRDLEINVLPLLTLLEMCRTKGASPTIIYAGTVTEAGIPGKLPVDESHPDNPVTIYDLHKLAAENYLKHYIRESFVKGTILRLANVYGPGPKSSRKDRGILNQMIGKALRGESITIYGEGNFIRDYVYIGDVVNAFLAAAAHIDNVNGNHFVIGSGKGVTIKEAFTKIGDRVKASQNISVDILHIDEPPDLAIIEKRNFVADTSRFTGLTNWKPRVELTEGIDRTIAWYLEN